MRMRSSCGWTRGRRPRAASLPPTPLAVQTAAGSALYPRRADRSWHVAGRHLDLTRLVKPLPAPAATLEERHCIAVEALGFVAAGLVSLRRSIFHSSVFAPTPPPCLPNRGRQQASGHPRRAVAMSDYLSASDETRLAIRFFTMQILTSLCMHTLCNTRVCAGAGSGTGTGGAGTTLVLMSNTGCGAQDGFGELLAVS